MEYKARGIQIFVVDNIEKRVFKEKTIAKLQKYYQLSKEQAEQYYEKYSKKK